MNSKSDDLVSGCEVVHPDPGEKKNDLEIPGQFMSGALAGSMFPILLPLNTLPWSCLSGIL
jgi:hypothetical protein